MGVAAERGGLRGWCAVQQGGVLGTNGAGVAVEAVETDVPTVERCLVFFSILLRRQNEQIYHDI